MSDNPSDPMSFLKNLWGNNGFALPGMVTPTLDTDELEKRISDLKTVEGWLRTNLSMLSMTIQNLEMQRTTLSAVKTMSQMYSDAQQQGGSGAGGDSSAFAQAAMWPWQMMQQMQESMQQAGESASAAAAAGHAPAAAAASSGATESAAQAGGSRRKKSS